MPKKWIKPKLIVLVKSKSEEAVLMGCKTLGGFISGPSFIFRDCFEELVESCQTCSSPSPS